MAREKSVRAFIQRRLATFMASVSYDAIPMEDIFQFSSGGTRIIDGVPRMRAFEDEVVLAMFDENDEPVTLRIRVWWQYEGRVSNKKTGIETCMFKLQSDARDENGATLYAAAEFEKRLPMLIEVKSSGTIRRANRDKETTKVRKKGVRGSMSTLPKNATDVIVSLLDIDDES